MLASTAAPLALRQAQDDDLPLLRRVYASARQEELALADWDEAQKESFLRMQFDLQARYFAQAFPRMDYQVVLRDGQPIGRLMVDRTPDRLLLVDIALLPEHRNAGIGTALVKAVQSEAATTGRPVVLHVARTNRARLLYERLGFSTFDADDVYLEMRWRPGGGATTQPPA